MAPAVPRRPGARAWTGRRCGRSRRDRRVHRFNTAGPSGLVDRKAPGRQRRLDPEQQQELARCLESGPELAQDGVVRWRLADLCALVERRFGVRYQERGMGKLVRALGFSRVSARPRHPKAEPEAQAEEIQLEPEAALQLASPVVEKPSGSLAASLWDAVDADGPAKTIERPAEENQPEPVETNSAKETTVAEVAEVEAEDVDVLPILPNSRLGKVANATFF